MFINGVFEGGGIKGLAYIGALRFLEERGFQFKYVAGSSVGSLFAALIAAKFSSYEIENIVKDFNVNILTATRGNKPINKFIYGLKDKGLYTIKNFENFLDQILKSKNCNKFKDVKIGENYRLKIIVTDLKKREMVIIPDDLSKYHYSKDQFPIAKAVAMSCSLPVVFTPYKIHNHTFVDGGVVNNFPINLFNDMDIPTIGFKLNEDKNPNTLINKYRIKVFKASDCHYQLENYNIVRINTQGFKVADFKRGLENYQELIKLGYNSMKNYFYEKYRC